MHMYCNYAKEHRTLIDENLPVGLILCADKGHTLANYAQNGLPKKIMAANSKTVLPNSEVLQLELEKARLMLEERGVGRRQGNLRAICAYSPHKTCAKSYTIDSNLSTRLQCQKRAIRRAYHCVMRLCHEQALHI